MRRKMILLQRIGFLGMFIVLIFSTLSLVASIDQQTVPGKPIVLMELFTSQGCSSCPPADAILAEYAKSQNEQIIPLAFHVDYWNRLGWIDSFSNSAYSDRQKWYSEHIPKATVYTPQLVVNGKTELVGNNRNLVSSLVKKELSAKAAENISIDAISIGAAALGFHYKINDTNPDLVLNIALVQKQAITHINAGENKDITITNCNIVRSFNTQVLTNNGSGKINLPVSFKAADYALVLFVQNKKDLSISAAARKDL